MTPRRVLIVGLGRIGYGYDAALDDRYIYSHARAFARHPAFTLVGGVDPSECARGGFTAQYHVPAWRSLDDVPGTVIADLAVVACPTEHHAGAVAAALDRWPLGALLCEKPLADNLADAERIVTAAADARVPCFVNFFRRAEPGCVEVRARFRDGRIATPVKGTLWYSKGLIHNGSHLVDLAQFWLGGWQAGARLAWSQDADPDLAVEFERGRLVVLAAREQHYSHYTMEIVAPNGRMRYDLNGTVIEWQPVVPHSRLEGYRVLQPDGEVIVNDASRAQWHVTTMLADALEGRPHNLCSGDEALNLQRRLHAVLESR